MEDDRLIVTVIAVDKREDGLVNESALRWLIAATTATPISRRKKPSE